MKEIKIHIPEGKDFKRWAQIALYKVRGGFACGCGNKQPFIGVQFDSYVNDKRFMFQRFAYDKKVVCPDCIIKNVNDAAEKIFKVQCTCDWCKQDKLCMGFEGKNDMYFGSRWWNGHYICQTCLNDAFLNRGELTSNRHYMDGTEMICVNELGLKVKRK